MLEPSEIPEVRERVQRRAESDRRILDALREEVRPLKTQVRQIMPRSATAMSLVASDGGNNKIQFDPFLMEIVRVVDSYGQQLCLDVVSPTTNTDELSDRQFNAAGQPVTALGHMMSALGKRKLYDVSPMIPRPKQGEDATTVNPSWVQVFRDLCEWAVLHERICRTEFSTDTLIIRDGLLRSKVFHSTLFIDLRNRLEEGIDRARTQRKRKLYLVGMAKRSKVLARYRLAMALEDVLTQGFPCYIRIPREIEAKAYVWPEYAWGREEEGEGEGRGEAPKFVAGVLHLVKFGRAPGDPIWAVDLLESQVGDDALVFGHLLADAIDGFPVPLYPRCLQKAHEHAALVDFDMDILEEEIFRAVRATLPQPKLDALDAMRLHGDPSSLRYE
jgi:hypothetical protein